MTIDHELLTVRTEGRGTYELTDEVRRFAQKLGVERGLISVFVQHTSASLIVCENADPAVRRDLERWFTGAVKDGDPAFEHDAEGPDDMPAHIRSVLTQTSVTIPMIDGRCGLGTWQGLFLWEHRFGGSTRRVVLSAFS